MVMLVVTVLVWSTVLVTTTVARTVWVAVAIAVVDCVRVVVVFPYDKLVEVTTAVNVVVPVVSATVFVTKIVAVMVIVDVATPGFPVVCSAGGCDAADDEGNRFVPHSPSPTTHPSPQ